MNLQLNFTETPIFIKKKEIMDRFDLHTVLQ